MKSIDALAISIGFTTVFLVCQLLAFVAVFGFCINGPGIDHCGGHDKVGDIVLFALLLGSIFAWRVVVRIKWIQSRDE